MVVAMIMPACSMFHLHSRTKIKQSPSETLLIEINVHPIHPRSTPLSHFIRQSPNSTNTDSNRTHRSPNLQIEQGSNVGLARKHLYSRARALNLLRAARPRYA